MAGTQRRRNRVGTLMQVLAGLGVRAATKSWREVSRLARSVPRRALNIARDLRLMA